ERDGGLAMNARSLVVPAVLAGPLASGQTPPASATPPAILRLTHSVAAYASWSPDGSRLVFQSSAAGNFDLYVIDRDGSNLRVLAASPADDITPAFSPDGTHILFVSEREGNREIYVMDADGSHPTNLSRDPGSDIHPSWSADGK